MSRQGETDEDVSRFDRFVEMAHQHVSRAPFFVLCVAVIFAWLLAYPIFGDPKSWQIVIHTVTSVVTLLLVALIENAARRDANAAQEKLSTIAGALADLMASRAHDDEELEARAAELRRSVGLEDRTGS